jgi:hypothetical protein
MNSIMVTGHGPVTLVSSYCGLVGGVGSRVAGLELDEAMPWIAANVAAGEQEFAGVERQVASWRHEKRLAGWRSGVRRWARQDLNL